LKILFEYKVFYNNNIIYF